MQKEVADCLQAICQCIYDKKGMNILVLDVRDVSTLTDYFIIAEGNVERHVKGISSAIYDLLLETQNKPIHTEVETEGDWIVLDSNTVIIHLFTPELREKYMLEQVWKQGKIVDVPIMTLREV